MTKVPAILKKKEIAFHQLSDYCEVLRRHGHRIVATGGCFDLLHPGHVQFLNTARSLGDTLLVAINDDESVHHLKGEGRPIYSLLERMEMVASLESVRCVTIMEGTLPHEFITCVKPDIWVKGADYERRNLPERKLVEILGGKVVFVRERSTHHTSTLLERLRSTEKREPRND